jgi:putative transposase
VEIIKWPDEQRGLIIPPGHWVVEHTFAWFGRYRRPSKDYERLLSGSCLVWHTRHMNPPP